MKYNERYDLYLDDDFVIYYWDKNLDKLMQKPIFKNNKGYLQVHSKLGTACVHRVIYETFVGPIPDGYQIDHINSIRDDNRLENLRCVTPKENMNNPLTRKRLSETNKGNTNGKGKRGKTYSEFGRKFKEHYGISKYQNPNLYHKESRWYHTHDKVCSWEV